MTAGYAATAPGHAAGIDKIAQMPDAAMRCPRCRVGLRAMGCPSCGFRIRMREGIFDALLPERALRYRILAPGEPGDRPGESPADGDEYGAGYGDEAEPHPSPAPGGLAAAERVRWRMRARTARYLMSRLLRVRGEERAGRVLDLGAGDCWMSYCLALEGFSPYALDLTTSDRDGLGAARSYLRSLPELFPRYRAELVRLPFEGGQFDAAIFHEYLPLREGSEPLLSEALRCVRRGGLVILADLTSAPGEEGDRRGEHGRRAAERSPDRGASPDADSDRGADKALAPAPSGRRLRLLARRFTIRWQIHRPWYGMRRGLPAAGPSGVRIYCARKLA